MTTVVQLRAECKAAGLKGYSRLRKAQLVEMLEAHRCYDGAADARKSYDVGIAACRAKLESFNKQEFLGGMVSLFCGDCSEVLKLLPDASVDSVVCDPPYHLTLIVKRYGKTSIDGDGTNERRAKARADGMARLSGGFMGKQWDGGDIAQRVEVWREVFRVLKPGGHLVAFSGTRTYHRMVCAIEDAGFEIRDQIGWAYGSGFPKSHDVSKGLDKRAGAEREVIRERYTAKRIKPGATVVKEGAYGKQDVKFTACDTAPTTPQAAEWQGWGTALKPSWEPIVLARKPLIGTVVENVLRYRTGAINIDGCRVEHSEECKPMAPQKWEGREERIIRQAIRDKETTELKANGRWPANLIHDGSKEVLAAFPDSDGQQRAVGPANGAKSSVNVYGDYGPRYQFEPRCDNGSAARFFYTAKADAEDRLGSKHPTVKPLDLMQWLVRLVTPKGGTVLDPFAGTGTTGEAAWREGMKAILIEREEEYQTDIARRMELAANPTKRAAVAATKNNLIRPEDLPLFKQGEAAE